jgi:hypothetical protein
VCPVLVAILQPSSMYVNRIIRLLIRWVEIVFIQRGASNVTTHRIHLIVTPHAGGHDGPYKIQSS